MAPQVEGGEPDPVYGQLLAGGVQRGHVLGHAVVLEHVQQRRLPDVVQAKEQQLAALLPQAKVAQGAGHPIPEEHLVEVFCGVVGCWNGIHALDGMFLSAHRVENLLFGIERMRMRHKMRNICVVARCKFRFSRPHWASIQVFV